MASGIMEPWWSSIVSILTLNNPEVKQSVEITTKPSCAVSTLEKIILNEDMFNVKVCWNVEVHAVAQALLCVCVSEILHQSFMTLSLCWLDARNNLNWPIL